MAKNMSEVESNNYKLEIKNLYKIFGPKDLSFVSKIRDGMSKQELLDKHNHVLGLNDINLSIPEQKVQVIMGLSGSGKSTLIRHVNRLIEPTSGELYVDGENVLEMSQSQLREFRRKSTSMVFQKFALLPHKTVSQNVAYGLTIQGVKEKLAKEQSHRWIDRVGLGGFEERYPAQLSGGMQQRVGLARALATDAPILLMDEAFSALDPLIRTDMQNILLELQEELHKTILFITHDLDEALRIGDNIAILRDGKIIQEGDPQDIIMNPADDYVKAFVKDVNRAKVIKAKIIMKTAAQANDIDKTNLIKVHEEEFIEDFLPKIVCSDSNCEVVDKSGNVKGYISNQELQSSLTRS